MFPDENGWGRSTLVNLEFRASCGSDRKSGHGITGLAGTADTLDLLLSQAGQWPLALLPASASQADKCMGSDKSQQ
jgi:hypothetical protein